MIKTIILDQQKVEAFLKRLEPNPISCGGFISLIDRELYMENVVLSARIKNFLEATKVKTQ